MNETVIFNREIKTVADLADFVIEHDFMWFLTAEGDLVSIFTDFDKQYLRLEPQAGSGFCFDCREADFCVDLPLGTAVTFVEPGPVGIADPYFTIEGLNDEDGEPVEFWCGVKSFRFKAPKEREKELGKSPAAC